MVHLPRTCPACGEKLYHYAACHKCKPPVPVAHTDAELIARADVWLNTVTTEIARPIMQDLRDALERHSAPLPKDGQCHCTLPRREDCERIGFPSGCYHSRRAELATRAEAAEARARTSGASNQWSIQVIGDLRAERDAIEARTIERCARIDFSWTGFGQSISAAIRTLAKEPADAKG